MSAVVLQMVCVAGLLGLAALAIVLSRSKISTPVIYGATLAVSAIALIGALRFLLGGAADATTLTLPVGLPWLGAHFPSMHWPRSSSSSSIWVGRRQVSMASATAIMTPHRTACFPSSPPFSPA